MPEFRYDSNDKRGLWKRNNEVQLERALEKVSTFFSARSWSPSAPVVAIAPSVNACSGRRRGLPEDIISFDIEATQTSDAGP